MTNHMVRFGNKPGARHSQQPRRRLAPRRLSLAWLPSLMVLLLLPLSPTLMAQDAAVATAPGQASDIDRQLLARQQTLNQRYQELEQRKQLLQQALQSVADSQRMLDEQIEVFGGSVLLSRVLYEQYHQLPRAQIDHQLDEEITHLRLEQFELGRSRQQLQSRLEQAVDDELAARLIQRRQHQDQLIHQLNELLSLALDVERLQQQLVADNRALRGEVEAQLFWMPSNLPVTPGWFSRLPGQLYQQARSWSPMTAVKAVSGISLPAWLAGLLPLILSLMIVARRSRLSRQLDQLNQEVGRFSLDSQAHTPKALLLTALLMLPGPLLLSALSLPLRLATGHATGAATESTVQLAGMVGLKLALLWWVIRFCRRLLAPNGVAQHHFMWPTAQLKTLRRMTTLIGLTLAPIVAVFALGARPPEQLADDRLGQLVLLFSGPILAWLLARASFAHGPQKKVRLLRGVTALTLSGFALLLAILTVLGYYYTAIKLGDRLLDSFYILLLWLLTSATASRGLAVAARQLDYHEATSRQNETTGSVLTEEGEAVEIKPAPLDLGRVNEQSLRLTRLLLLLAFGLVFYWVWADLIGAFAYMDSIILWEQLISEGEHTLHLTTSLADVTGALLLLVVTLMLARNLPGLLEMLVLSKLELKPGTPYAITSLLSYSITAIGLIIALSALGVSWSKLQWLVAALGVGLGFGLQEIFANFVSGLIILFEKPIRIGDVITIGDLSGTVNRIRIRATTITDFDRKEIIVPNKAFVTDRLVNWSLSDRVTRLVLKIGFAYGSDLDKARKILLEAASENQRVLSDPEPRAYFLGFGASTLDHELRVHVGDLADRLPVTDELNRRIDQLCREQGVEIAFSQLDIHIRSDDTRPPPAAPASDNNS